MAINAKGTESALETRTFIMDRTAPVKPTLLSPRNDSLFSKTPVTLSWKQHTDSGAPLFDSVFIATDSLFRNMPDVEKVASSGNYDFKPTSNTTYYWRVRTFDNAGNSSSYSNWLKFRYNAK